MGSRSTVGVYMTVKCTCSQGTVDVSMTMSIPRGCKVGAYEDLTMTLPGSVDVNMTV